MKKILAIILLAIISLFSFVGCGNVDDAAKEAEGLVTDASESVSKAADDMMNNTNGDVSDDTSDNGNVNDNTDTSDNTYASDNNNSSDI